MANIKQFRFFNNNCEKNTYSDTPYYGNADGTKKWEPEGKITYAQYVAWKALDDDYISKVPLDSPEIYNNVIYYYDSKEYRMAKWSSYFYLQGDDNEDPSNYAPITEKVLKNRFKNIREDSDEATIRKADLEYYIQGFPYICEYDLIAGTIFLNYMPFQQLNIHTLPGTMFYMNKSQKPVIVDATGIFIIDLSENVKLEQLSFDTISVKTINDLPNGYLIIDIIY